MRKKKRTSSDMIAEQNYIRISSHEKLCAERMKTIFKKLDELNKDVKEMKADMNRWKGAGGIIILLGGLIGSVFYFFIK